MGLFVTFIILETLLIVIGVILMIQYEGDGFWLVLIGGLLIWLSIEHKTVKYTEPIPIKHSELSILMDDEVAIIRYNDNTDTYSSVKYYKAIKEGNFKYMVTKEFDVLGEPNGETYEIEITKKD